tara:strand:- start:60 stop:1175 length:1116 start_codon:yes stop_codon:yes gene_type:complete
MLDSPKNLGIHDNSIAKALKNSKTASSYDNIYSLDLDNLFSDDLLQIKKDTNGERTGVLIYVAEPHYFNPGSTISRQWLQFKDLLLKYQIFNCDFFVTCFGTSAYDTSIDYLNKNFYDWKFYTIDIDYPFFSNIVTGNPLKDTSDLFLNECTMKFSYLSFTHRMHRQLFSKFLIKEELVRDNLVAINLSRNDVNEAENMLIEVKDTLIDVETTDGWFYNKNLLDLWRDVPLEYHRHPSIDDDVDATNLTFLNKAAFNITSETVFEHPYVHPTEKTTQALLSKRPFIMIGPCGSLQHLRDRGFKTFHSIINESYDKIEDPNKRLEAVMQLVLELNKKSQQELNDMVYAVKDTMIHNCSLMLEKIRNFTNTIE